MDAATRARVLALAGVELRGNQSQSTGATGGSAYNQLHPHVASGPTGGQFAAKGQGSGIGVMPNGPYPSSKKKSKGRPMPTPAQTVGIKRSLRLGDTGDDVKQLQAALTVLGLDAPVNGEYNANTEKAIRQVQQKLGVAQTGHASPALLSKMQDAIKLSPCLQQRSDDDELEERDLEDDLDEEEEEDDLDDEDEEDLDDEE